MAHRAMIDYPFCLLILFEDKRSICLDNRSWIVWSAALDSRPSNLRCRPLTCAPQKLDLNSSCHFLQPIFMMESAKNVFVF